MLVSRFLAFIVTLSKVIIFFIESFHPDINKIGKLIFIQQTIQVFSYIQIHPLLLEFTVAQSPIHMRGVMLELWYVTS